MKYKNTALYLKFVLLILLLALPCCTSVFTSQKLDTSGKIINEPSGIPYTLTMPEFKIIRKASEKDDTIPEYELKVSYIPDPRNRYTINIKTFIFSDPNLVISLEDDGRLSSISNTYTERITPTIKSIGSFTGNIIGALAAGVFDKISIRGAIAQKVKNCPTCFSCAGECEQLRERIVQYKNDDIFINEFHILCDAEKQCLKNASEQFLLLQTEMDQSRVLNWESIRDSYINSESYTYLDKIFIDYVEEAVGKDYVTAFDDLKKYFKEYHDNRNEETRRRVAYNISKHIGVPFNKTVTEKFEKWSDLLSNAPTPPSNSLNLAAYDLLNFIINMPNNMWRARHTIYLENRIDHLEYQQLVDPTQKSKNKITLERLNALRADTIGVRPLFDRLNRIKIFLSTIPKSPVRYRDQKVLDDYKIAREEAELLEKEIQQARAKLLLEQKPAATPVKIINETIVYNASAELIERENGYYELAGKDLKQINKIQKTAEMPEDHNSEIEKINNSENSNETSQDELSANKVDSKKMPEFIIRLERLP